MSNHLDSELCDRTSPVRESMKVQRRLWLVERVGFWILLLTVLLTLMGLFSNGLLSNATAGPVGDVVQIKYERFMRSGTTATLVVDLRGPPNASRWITITGEMLEGAILESIQPQPLSSATSDRSGVAFHVTPDQNGDTRLYISLRVEGVGLYRSHIGVDGTSISLWQFIYP
jgi:hypothetical protein